MSKLFRMLTAVILFAIVAQGAFAQTATPTPTWTANEAEIIGVLEAIDLNSVTVNGIIINVTGAEVETGLAVGDTVKVHATLVATVWQAREVESVVITGGTTTPTGEFEITGVLTATGSGFIVVAGQIIDVSAAEINDTLTLGDLVKVHVSNVSGQLIAREVEIAFGDAPTCATGTPDGWRNYRVRAGDTLSDIAARTGTSVLELARVNCITDTGLVIAGTLLFVPRSASGDISNDNGNDDDDNGNDDNGNDDNGNGNDDNGNDDNGNDDNGNDDNGNDDNGNDDNGNDDDDNGNDDNGNDDNGNDDNGNDDNGNDD